MEGEKKDAEEGDRRRERKIVRRKGGEKRRRRKEGEKRGRRKKGDKKKGEDMKMFEA